MSSTERPLVSFVLLAYKQEQFIREAVAGAFSQTYSPLEIILSDDCSPDRTFEIMQEMAAAYTGPHKLILNRNSSNLGLGRHYSRLMEVATGDVVELAAGDDISLPQRTNDSVRILVAHPEIMAVSLGLIEFEGNSVPAKPPCEPPERIEVYDLERFVADVDFHVNAPARAFRKFTHDYFGPLSDRCPVEDGPNLFRCFLHGKVAVSSKASVLYRIHANSVYSTQNRFKISFQHIYEDYENTLEIAESKGLIDAKTRERLWQKLNRRLAQRLTIMKVEASTSTLAGCVRYVLLSRSFGVREKLKRLYDSVRSSLCK